MITYDELLEIIISHSEPVTNFDAIIISRDFKDLAKEIEEAIKKNKYGIDLI